MWPDVLHDIRSIEFVLPAISPTCSTVRNELFYLDLCFAIDHLKAHADMPILTIIVNVNSVPSITNGDREWFYEELVNQRRDKAQVFQAFVQLLNCLKPLRSMRSFFVHIEWATHWSVEHPRIGLSEHDDLDLRMNEMESWLEKMVMGDEYDSEAMGKLKRQPSIWLYVVWATLSQVWWSSLPEQTSFMVCPYLH
ncbi:uncharacterized protein GGS22DRAFT_184165 [Annulohypoxylon maeteangense]|uniref:uncharacterized protein n=1 Tax=Annulohypoxylon maeteangense TaxID=1927788 RepID=UPI0020076C86|nr:uncharacterized protein GGS22DRAFT_184165 [Annulohypoxylon maeteangense]KAI0888586.1 hypothetical protein GGS22DRAFT_184165 [Annulohypoxylon maeteangense]